MKWAIAFIIIILSFTSTAVKATDFSKSDWHDAIICNPCHESILPQSVSKEIYDGCICHYPPEKPVWNNEIDIQSIRKIHGNKPCIQCHINSIGSLTLDNLHRAHYTTDCGDCHGNDKIIRPEYSECSSCHKSEIHGVHNDLEGLCVICHGKYGEDTVNNFQSANMPVTADVSMLLEDKNRKFPTIIEVLTSLLQIIKI
ncbi:MAG: cytochrome c family protein [ANME-2 cluster archaeon]|nr:cytochrome c family protein [ANME-2 cluster archaeon]